jgi:hypothetical protein
MVKSYKKNRREGGFFIFYFLWREEMEVGKEMRCK